MYNQLTDFLNQHMASPKKSVETLVQSIKDELSQIKSAGSQYAIALWPEADGGAGYLIHVDGRMMPTGDYQAGFSHVDELLDPSLSPEFQRYARAESGRIVSTMENLEDDVDLREEATQYAPLNFAADSDLVDKAITAGLTLEGVFDLYASLPKNSHLVQDGGSNRALGSARLTESLFVSRLLPDEAGKLSWVTTEFAPAGSSVSGTEFTYGLEVPVPGGRLVLKPTEYRDFIPSPTPNAARRCP